MAAIPDNGCSAHDDCFTCPFSACRYEMNHRDFAREVRLLEWLHTFAEVQLLTDAGMGKVEAVEKVSESLGHTRRTVYRHLSAVEVIMVRRN